MLRAISTRYLGPTNSHGSRIKAIARKREGDLPAIALTDNWDHGASIEENHTRVAKLLAAKMNWGGLYIGGGTDDGFVFVNAGDAPLARRWADKEFGKVDRDWFYLSGEVA